MDKSNIKLRLTIMNILQFAVWGAYLTTMGSYLFGAGLATGIGSFYGMQGIVSLFMPALMGIVADRWVPAQRLLGLCHLLAGGFMVAAWYYTGQVETVEYSVLYTLYSLSVAFYMPTLALSNSVAYTCLERSGEDLVKAFPPIRVFGTVGFLVMMYLVSLLGFETKSEQFLISGLTSVVLFAYTFTLPNCPVVKDNGEQKSLVEALGLRAFSLFKQRKMALFFIFSMLLGVSLQITNGFANPYLKTFEGLAEYSGNFFVEHSSYLIGLSQISETLCILLIPFALKRFGIKNVMLIAMIAWALRFAFLGMGNPGSGIGFLIASMIVYGVAFDFFNVSGSLFVDRETDPSIRSSAQGLFMIMTNGIGAAVGSFAAGAVVSHFAPETLSAETQVAGWQTSWYVFAGYSLVVAVLFLLLFRYKHSEEAI